MSSDVSEHFFKDRIIFHFTHTHTLHIFFYSSIDGFLDCFCFLAVVDDAAMNTGIQMCLNLCFQFFWIYTQVKLLDHIVILVLIFRGLTILFSIVTALFEVPTRNAQGSQFLYSLANTF